MATSKILDPYGRPVAYSNYYEGLGWSRERINKPTIIGDSKDTITQYNRLEAMHWGRRLVANMGIFRGPVQEMATYSVGSGLTPLPQVDNDKVAALHEEYFSFWGEQADYYGRYNINQLTYFACAAIDVDGDLGFNMYAPNSSAMGQLQTVYGHRIVGEEDGFKDGVREDSNGRPSQYRIRNGENDFQVLDAGNFIFLADPDRADGNRSISSLAFAIAHGRDILDTIGFAKTGLKMDQAIGVVIKTLQGQRDPGSSFIENGFTAKDTGGLPWETWKAGMIPRLKVGEDIESFKSDRPSEQFMRFTEFLIRDIAVGLGLPFEFLWDLSGMRGSGSRFILAKAQRRFEQRQALLISKFLTRVYRWVIAKGIKRGEIPSAPGWWNVKWQTPARITVDMGREAQANRDDLKYGNRTLQEDAGERGVQWRDLRVQKSIEAKDLIDRALELVDYSNGQLTLDKAIFLLSADSPNAPQLPTAQPTIAE